MVKNREEEYTLKIIVNIMLFEPPFLVFLHFLTFVLSDPSKNNYGPSHQSSKVLERKEHIRQFREGKTSDFESDKNISVIAFGSCK